MLYYNLSSYLREKYGKRLTKICIDGGFSCPNRDGKCGTGGCIYCGERGAGEHLDPTISIEEQVYRGLSDTDEGDAFIVYFQSFSNTYAPIPVLKERYDAALFDPRVKVFAVGTRPDCIDEDVCRLLSEYKERFEVWVELGLQTANDKTAALINRGYPRVEFERAMALLEKYDLKAVVHLIIGLPGEGGDDVFGSVEYLKRFKIFGVKIHSMYVMEGTRLAEMYHQGLYTPPTLDEYARICAEAVRRLPEEVVIHRLTGDCPRDLLVAPAWNRNKRAVLDAIIERLK